MEHIGDNIRKIRVLLDIKQAIMAKMLNLSVNSYGKIERNQIHIKPERLRQIAGVFEMDPLCIVDFDKFIEQWKTSGRKQDHPAT